MTDRQEQVVRGCGVRKVGGVYLTVPTSQYGSPLEHFLVCPPRPVDAGALGLTPRGVQLIKDERTGVHHVIDWVGQDNYPNVTDILEESRRYGVSRRVAKSLRFNLLSEKSRLMLVHSRAHIDNAADYRAAILEERAASVGKPLPAQTAPFACPRQVTDHGPIEVGGEPNPLMCGSLWYDDVEEGESLLDPKLQFRAVERRVGSTLYRARHRPFEITPRYRLAVFASFPIGKIEVVRDTADGTHEDAVRKASQADGIPVYEVDA